MNAVKGTFKMGAYKMLSEVSPLIQYKDFTSNHPLLEALDDAANIHIIDFDMVQPPHPPSIPFFILVH